MRKTKKIAKKKKAKNARPERLLTKESLGWVKSLVDFYWFKYGDFYKKLGLGKEDVFQKAWVVMRKSADRYDPSKGISFRTFAATRLNGWSIDLLREVHIKKIETVSLSSFTGDFFPDYRKTDQISRRRRATILKIVRGLKDSHRNKKMLVEFFGLDGRPPKTQDAIANELKLTPARVSQVLSAMLAKLRANKEMRAYLK